MPLREAQIVLDFRGTFCRKIWTARHALALDTLAPSPHGSMGVWEPKTGKEGLGVLEPKRSDGIIGALGLWEQIWK